MITEWTNISGLVQGDIQYSLRTTSVSNTHIFFSVLAYSEKWNKFDISFQYRANKEEEWSHDAFLTSVSSERISGNKVIGLDASKYGEINQFVWEYSKNSIAYGENIEVKISTLPRIRQFSTANSTNIVSQAFAESLAQIDGIVSGVKVIGTNNDGAYICSTDIALFIRNEPNGANIPQRYSFGKITHAIQMPSRNYMVSDSVAGTVVELSEDLSTIIETLTVSNVDYFDYNEEQETLLVTRKTDNLIEEYTWGDGDYGTLLWASTFTLDNPESATYKTDDASKIVVADGLNRIVLVSKDTNTPQYISRFHFYEVESSQEEITNFNKPFRVFWTGDNIYIVEKEGRVLAFEDFLSSSSSSIDSSSSTSSSSE